MKYLLKHPFRLLFAILYFICQIVGTFLYQVLYLTWHVKLDTRVTLHSMLKFDYNDYDNLKFTDIGPDPDKIWPTVFHWAFKIR